MSQELVICLSAVAVNLLGMLVIYSAMSHALAGLAWRRRGAFAVIVLIALAQLFWIAPALWIVGRQGPSHTASYALWFGNWLVSAFSLILFWKSAARIPLALSDAARLDGLGGFGTWRQTVLPFVKRDLAVIAAFTVMATLLPFWGFINQPDASNIITVYERTMGLGEQVGMMVLASLVGALPLVGIFVFGTDRPSSLQTSPEKTARPITAA
jgi:ABC-type glycerol-3-phosphate transport system permease component